MGRGKGASDIRPVVDNMWRPATPIGWNVVRLRRSLIKSVVTAIVVIVALRAWDGGAAFYLGLLAASITGLIDGRLSVAAGLVCIAACPILQIAEPHAWLQQSNSVNYYAANLGLYSLTYAADTVAVWAYY